MLRVQDKYIPKQWHFIWEITFYERGTHGLSSRVCCCRTIVRHLQSIMCVSAVPLGAAQHQVRPCFLLFIYIFCLSLFMSAGTTYVFSCPAHIHAHLIGEATLPQQGARNTEVSKMYVFRHKCEQGNFTTTLSPGFCGWE